MAEKSPNDESGLDDSISGEFPENADSTEKSQKLNESDTGTVPKKIRLHTPSPGPEPFMVQPSPPKFVTFDDLMAAASGVRNMSLAHEIAVDSNFKFENVQQTGSSLQKQVKEIIHKAFWDAFSEKLEENPPDFGHAVVLIKEVKESLMSVLLPQHKRLQSQMEEVLDLDLIQQKLENDAFDIYYYSDYVVGIMGKLCAPARDDRIAKLKETKEIVPLFKEIFEVLDLMRMDMANFTIQQIRPYIQQQSVEFEKKKFEEFIMKQQEAGIDGLELTKCWLARSLENLKSRPVAPEEEVSQPNMPTPAAILNGAYMELLQWDTSRIFPETLVLDQSRYLELREQTLRLTMVTSILLVTFNTVGQSIAGVQSLKVKLKEEICTLLEGGEEAGNIETALENISEQVSMNVEVFLKDHGFQPRSETQKTSLKGQIVALKEKDNQIYTIMSKRVIDFIQQTLFSKLTEPLKIPAGMSVMEKELSQICGQFLRLISHNKSVFGQYYASIIGTLIKPLQTDPASTDHVS